MELRDDIRYYEVRSALPAKLIKTSREYKSTCCFEVFISREIFKVAEIRSPRFTTIRWEPCG